MNKTLGSTLKTCRKARGWSLRAAAENIGVSKTTIVNLEGDLTDDPRTRVLDKVCNAYGLDHSYLIHLLLKG